MKDLIINGSTTLCLPDNDDEIEIEIDDYECSHSIYVSFEVFEKWIASIRAAKESKIEPKQTKKACNPKTCSMKYRGECNEGCVMYPPEG